MQLIKEIILHLYKRISLIIVVLLLRIVAYLSNYYMKTNLNLENINAEIFSIFTTVILVDFFIERERTHEKFKILYCSYISTKQVITEIYCRLLNIFQVQEDSMLEDYELLKGKSISTKKHDNQFELLTAAEYGKNEFNSLVTTFSMVWEDRVLSKALELKSMFWKLENEVLVDSSSEKVTQNVIEICKNLSFFKREIKKAEIKWNSFI